MKKHKNKSNSEKLDVILEKLNGIENKVDSQNEEMERLRKEIEHLKRQVNQMSKSNRTQSLLAGGVGGGLVAVGIELIRMKFGG